jgi:hypothetical protein
MLAKRRASTAYSRPRYDDFVISLIILPKTSALLFIRNIFLLNAKAFAGVVVAGPHLIATSAASGALTASSSLPDQKCHAAMARRSHRQTWSRIVQSTAALGKTTDQHSI